jgi:large subunit ribosomal protein L18
MITPINRRAIRRRIRHRIRKKISGTGSTPRLAVYRSGKHIYAQAINDLEGRTLATASTLDPELKGKLEKGGNIEAAKAVGALIADRLKAAGCEAVVFDRGGFLFHGRVKALAEAARSAGLKF